MREIQDLIRHPDYIPDEDYKYDDGCSFVCFSFFFLKFLFLISNSFVFFTFKVQVYFIIQLWGGVQFLFETELSEIFRGHFGIAV